MPNKKPDTNEDEKDPSEEVKRDAFGNEIIKEEDALPEPEDEETPDLEPAEAPQESGHASDLRVSSDRTGQSNSTEDNITEFDDEKTEVLINDIVAKEGDDLLAVQDAATGKGGIAHQQAKGSLWKRWWRSRWARRFTALLIFGGLVAAVAIPTARYWILNTAGVRSSVSVTVVDSSTQLPLKGVEVKLLGQKTKTDSDGKATLTGLKLGPATLEIDQTGFAKVKQQITIGWGSNPLGIFALKAVGVQYVIEVRGYLSGKPIEGVQAQSGDASAVSDKNGKITLTLASTVQASDSVTVSKGGYRTDQITLNADPKQPTKAVMVLARKAVYMSKQSGRYDVFKSDLDGKNRALLLAGSGLENSNSSLVMSPDGNRVALVSTRENKRDSDGFLLSTLTLINVENGDALNIAQAPQILLIDWIGSRLVFEQVSSDAAAANRHAVVSYNYSDNARLQLAVANKLEAVLSAQGVIYYAVAADSDNTSVAAGFFKVSPDGNNKQTVLKEDIWSVLRTAYDTFSLQTADGVWYNYTISSNNTAKVSAPGSLASRLYIDNADHTKSLWVNQGTLTSYEVAASKDVAVYSQNGVAYPVEWLSSNAVKYRVSSGGETADYAVSLEGGVPHKIADVSSIYGFAQAQ